MRFKSKGGRLRSQICRHQCRERLEAAAFDWFYFIVILLRWIIRSGLRFLVQRDVKALRARFWTHQSITIITAVVIIMGLISVWFDDPTRLATALGLVSAGIAFALQKVITALASYFVILRGNTFTVGDRIMMGGVRGDVIALGFIQTTIMEMGQPPPVQTDEPAMWVQSRQFTGRIVTVSNSQIFDEPVYNYTRDFSYIWEEIHVPITYKAVRDAAEKIMLAGNRQVKDLISRQILTEFDTADIGIASATYDIVGFPSVELKNGRERTQDSGV